MVDVKYVFTHCIFTVWPFIVICRYTLCEQKIKKTGFNSPTQRAEFYIQTVNFIIFKLLDQKICIWNLVTWSYISGAASFTRLVKWLHNIYTDLYTLLLTSVRFRLLILPYLTIETIILLNIESCSEWFVLFYYIVIFNLLLPHLVHF